MAYVSVEVDLDEFSTRDIIKELELRQVISKKESEKLLARKDPLDKEQDGIIAIDRDWVGEARWRASRGELGESLVMLARAYPEFDKLRCLAHSSS